MSDFDSLCPVCEGGYRYIYKLNGENLVFICEECESVWNDPDNTQWGHTASDRTLRDMYLVDNVNDLFNGDANWATREDIEYLISNSSGENLKLLQSFLDKFDLC